MVYIVQSWDGVIPWIKEAPPRWMRPQRRVNHPSISLKVSYKMRKLVARGYIKEGVILALTSFFSVPKRTYYNHMVFDATVSGRNDCLWDPNFMLTSMVGFLMMVVPEMHMFDRDVGGMFYNFRLSSVLAKFCGVDLGSYLGHKKDHQVTSLWIRWLRLMMGLVVSPYTAIQGLLW